MTHNLFFFFFTNLTIRLCNLCLHSHLPTKHPDMLEKDVSSSFSAPLSVQDFKSHPGFLWTSLYRHKREHLLCYHKNILPKSTFVLKVCRGKGTWLKTLTLDPGKKKQHDQSLSFYILKWNSSAFDCTTSMTATATQQHCPQGAAVQYTALC